MAKTFGGELTPGVTPRGKTVLKAFEYQDVRLLPGTLLTQVEQARRLYSSMSDCPSSDDLRHIAGFQKGGIGSSEIEIMRHAGGAASDGLRLSGV